MASCGGRAMTGSTCAAGGCATPARRSTATASRGDRGSVRAGGWIARATVADRPAPARSGGRCASLWRIHHALADGTTVMRIGRHAMWDEPKAGVEPKSKPGGRRRPPDGPRHEATGAAHARPRDPTPVAPVPVRPRDRLERVGRVREQRPRVASPGGGGDVRRDRQRRGPDGLSGGLRRWREAAHCQVGPVRVKVPVSLHGAGHGEGPTGSEIATRTSASTSRSAGGSGRAPGDDSPGDESAQGGP